MRDRRAAMVAAFVAVLALGGPASAQYGSDPGPIVTELVSPGTVLIRAVGSNDEGTITSELGTGFIVSADGHVLTASHVIPDVLGQTTLIIGATFGPDTGAGKPYKLELIKRSSKFDVAILRMVKPPTELRVLPLRQSKARKGEAIYVLGYPLGLPDTHILHSIIGASDDADLTTAALVDKGNSGGPVVDTNGCVLGIVYAGITQNEGERINGIKFAVPVASLAELLPASVVHTWSVLSQTNQPTVIHVTDTLSRTQTTHDLKATTTKYHDIIRAQSGYVIDAVEGTGYISLNPPELQYPTPVIAADKMSMSFDYSLMSGPFYDQTRGWIDMTINTRQRKIGTVTAAIKDACN